MADREGIDTPEERQILNYEPKIEYTLPRINSDEYKGTVETQVTPSILMQPIVVSTWDRATDIVKTLVELESTLSEKLKDDRVPVSLESKPTLVEAAKRYNYELTDYIPFSLYKVAITSPDSYEKNVIVDTYENHHADVNGNINAEIYTDVVEIKQDWDEMIKFIIKALFGQLVPVTNLPTSVDKNDPNIAKIDAAEKKLIESLVIAKREYLETLKTLKQQYLSDPEGDSFYKAQLENSIKLKILRVAERAVYSRTEVYSLVDAKMVSSDVLTTFISRSVDYKPFKKGSYEILLNLLRQYSSGQSIEKGLRRIQALMKLSVDGKIENVTNMKQDLRGVSSLANKTRMGKALTNGVHLRNNVFGEVHDLMNNFDGTPEEDSIFNTFANHIVDSVAYADKLYEDQSVDFHKVHAFDTDVRRTKLRGLIDKDSAREVYRLADRVVKYANERKSWPNKDNLTQWLNEFVKLENLN